MPLSAQDRSAGYDYRLSVWQMEYSLTQIVDRPMAGRQFFEEVIRDNLDLGPNTYRITLMGELLNSVLLVYVLCYPAFFIIAANLLRNIRPSVAVPH